MVNAAQQRLFMYENGSRSNSMVVVVGKTKYPTPMLAAYIRFAALNPYWYVPSDLAWDDVGQYVVKYGLKYLDDYGYEVVSDWSRTRPSSIPRRSTGRGLSDSSPDIMIRQKPGPQNFMGRIMFMLPNQFGVYLHDNPRRELFNEFVALFQRRVRPARGCVALEQMAVPSRADVGRRGDRAAGDAGAAGAGLYHLHDRDAGRRDDRLL